MTSPIPAPGEPLPHYVSTAPFDPYSVEVMTEEQVRVNQASQLRLMWWKFKRHKVALASGIFLAVLYGMILICEFLAPYDLHTRNVDFIYAPPQRVHFFHEGEFVGPFVYGRTMTLDMDTLKRNYAEIRRRSSRSGSSARRRLPFLGFVRKQSASGLPGGGRAAFPPGHGPSRPRRAVADHLRRADIADDRTSRITVSFVLGIVIGGLAGYHGGIFDLVVQRLIEVLQSIPSIPLWLSLAAIMPATWSPLLIYLGITVILGLLDWTGLARAVRSKLLALREEDYVLAAQLMGARSGRIIGRHLVPGFMSHLIATATISIPGMILGETALSFLGLGLRPPITSWGILLTEAKSVSVIAFYPWLLFPTIPVILVILAFNFLGDGLRDAADPYK